MAENEWTSLRVRKVTRERLQEMIRRTMERCGPLGHPDWLDGEELTADRMITRLMDHIEKDRERSRRHGKKRQRQQLVASLDYLNDRYDINPAFEEAECGAADWGE